MVTLSKSLDIDLSSVRIVPDLYRLCWTQYSSNNYSHLEWFNESPQKDNQLPIFRDYQTGGNVYCVEKKDRISSYFIALPLWGLSEEVKIPLRVVFSMPFNRALPIIRKKIVPNGVHFQLSLDFAGIYEKSELFCKNIMTYGLNKKENIIFDMDSIENTTIHIDLKPGTEFSIYYYCIAPSWMKTSTEFITDQRTVFQAEKTQPLQPFLQFPFRRFLVGQWRNPPNVPHFYQIVIYEIGFSGRENCLKVFLLYSATKLFTRSNIYPKNCDKGVNTEDLGAVDLVADRNIYVVLDMGVPLEKDVRYKMSIWWRNSSNQWEENFIYFEPLPNENSGNIHSDIYNYEPSNYENIRNKISDMRQNVIPQYSTNISSATFLKLSKFDEIMILPTVSSSPFKRLTSPKTISYDELNEKCKEIPSCSNGFHPLFYVMLTNKSQTDNFVELLPIPLKENFNISNLKLSSNSQDYTFTISWEILQQKTYTPSLFAIRIISVEDNCFALYIISCRTCNKEHKKISEDNFKELFGTWKRDCQKYERLENYGAMDSLIIFKTKEMIPKQIFIAEVYSINLYNTKSLRKSNPEFITEIFWRKYRTVMISLICTVIGLSVIFVIAIRLKALLKKTQKDTKEVDSNNYYSEDEI